MEPYIYLKAMWFIFIIYIPISVTHRYIDIFKNRIKKENRSYLYYCIVYMVLQKHYWNESTGFTKAFYLYYTTFIYTPYEIIYTSHLYTNLLSIQNTIFLPQFHVYKRRYTLSENIYRDVICIQIVPQYKQ